MGLRQTFPFCPPQELKYNSPNYNYVGIRLYCLVYSSQVQVVNGCQVCLSNLYFDSHVNTATYWAIESWTLVKAFMTEHIVCPGPLARLWLRSPVLSLSELNGRMLWSKLGCLIVQIYWIEMVWINCMDAVIYWLNPGLVESKII